MVTSLLSFLGLTLNGTGSTYVADFWILNSFCGVHALVLGEDPIVAFCSTVPLWEIHLRLELFLTLSQASTMASSLGRGMAGERDSYKMAQAQPSSLVSIWIYGELSLNTSNCVMQDSSWLWFTTVLPSCSCYFLHPAAAPGKPSSLAEQLSRKRSTLVPDKIGKSSSDSI